MSSIPFSQRPTCTIQEACEATSLSKTTLYAEMDANRIATKKIGTRRLVIVPSLLEFLKPIPSTTPAATSNWEVREAA